MAPHPAVTLVIPAYNRGDLIGATIESALQQTLPFAEVVVVDDGSTDNTPEVLSAFQNRIKVLRTSNQGVQSARNTGVAFAQTELVVLCDSDDLLEPEFLATMGPWMAQHTDVDCVYSNFVTFSANGEDPDKLSRCPFDFLEGSETDGCFATHIPDLYIRSVRYQPLFSSGVVVRKSFYHRIGGYNTAFRGVGAEDWEFTLRAISSGRVAMCQEQLVKIRKHEFNDSNDSIKMNLGEAKILEHSITHHTPQHTWLNEIRESIARRKLLALDDAYANENFELVKKISTSINYKISARTKLKIMISQLPKRIRRLIWQITQEI